MKKVILALAIVSVSFAACNDASKTDAPATDTTAPAPTPAPDTTTPAPAPVADTTVKADTTKK